ncbi:MAG: FkbM family methyltransferase [Saprospiraceae bacterium]
MKSNVISVEPQPIFIHYLKRKFKPVQYFKLIEGVVGSKTEKINFQINTMSPTISTARDKFWQQSINTYSSYRPPWDSEIETPSYTLDYLISEYGVPQFCKIDTEGFEWEVLQGLHHAIPCLSIEFLAFDLERGLLCIEKMAELGKYKINFSPGESQTFLWDEWKSVHEVKNILVNNDLDYKFGDLYFKIFN